MDPSRHGAPTALLPGGDAPPWGMFPNMDPSCQGAPTVPLPSGGTPPQAGCQDGVPFERPGFYFGGQPFIFQNGFPVPNIPGTMDGGHATQDGSSRGNVK